MKTLIILKPGVAGGHNLRLRLNTEDTKRYIEGKYIQTIRVDFGDGLQNVGNTSTYMYGSLQNSSVISNWLHQHNYTDTNQQLLFELEESTDGHTHTYRFIGKIIK